MEVTVLAVCVTLFSITLVSGTACVNTDGECSACNVTVSNETIQCKKCPLGCLSCQGENLDICTTCTRQHALSNGRCFHCANGCETCEFLEKQQVCKICERGYYLNESLCQQCLSHCQKCTSLNDCKACNKFCISCAPKCVTCTSYSSCTSCKVGFYGNSCTETCSDGCIELTCDKQNGSCSCKKGWHGQLCDKTCPVPCKSCHSGTLCNDCKHGYFGQVCERKCSVGCLNDLCDKNTGECTSCKTNYVGTNCDPCPEQYFGENCQEECPTSCRFCTSKTNCTVCRSSFFGSTCEKRCSDRCADNGCERNMGKCLQCKPNFTGVSCENCSDGFEGENCQGCVSGKYGFNCLSSCPSRCKTNVCNQLNGNCLTGCIHGTFGSKCENICPANCEQCISNTSCQTCTTGYRGELCSLKCPDGCNGSCYHDGTCIACAKGYYGNSCNLSCPEHCIGGHCNHTGFCTECIKDYYGHWCKNIDTKGIQLGDFVAPVVFVVLAVPVIVTVAVIIIKRKKLERCRTRDEELVMYSRMDMRQAEEQEEVATQDSSQTGIVTIGSYLYENIKGIPAQSVHTSEKTLNVLPPLDVELDDEEAYDEKAENDANIRLTPETFFSDVYTNAVEVRQRRIPLERLGDYVAQKSIEEMAEEFVSLPSGLINSFTVSQREENKVKNRYRGLYPYDKNRVILRGGNSEYINASYIDGHNKRRAYIACIGPTEKHMKNFIPLWEMVWQENVNTIVMLTNLWEHGFAKCDKYWPDNGNTEQYGEIVVLGKIEDIFEEYVVRTFIVKKQKDTRVIRQIQFTVWPDKGVPARVSSIVRLQREVKKLKEESEAPVIVHCSAGIGRTGTFIALDILTEEGMIEGYVDIYACVRNLREERVNMIQTFPQYQYLYEAVVESLLSDKYTLTEEQEAIYSNVSS